MVAIVFWAIELNDNKKLGPNVVFQNILKNLNDNNEHKFFAVFNKNYKIDQDLRYITEIFTIESNNYLNLYLKAVEIKKLILEKYSIKNIKFLYPKPIFLPIKNIQQYAFLYDLPFEKIYQGKTIEDLKKEFFFKQMVWKKLDKIFTVSYSSYKDIMKLVNLDNLDWFYLAVDPKIFKVIPENQNEEFLRKFFRKRKIEFVKDYFFLPAGKIWYRKNILNLVKAFKNFCSMIDHDVYLIITANNINSKEDYVKEVMNESFQKIVFLDLLDIEEVVNLYNGSLATIFPSFYEGFGFPVLESMSCGKNILFSKIDVFKELYPVNTYIFKPDSVKEMTDCMLNFYNKKDYFLNKRIIEEDIVKKFRWSKTVNELLIKMSN